MYQYPHPQNPMYNPGCGAPLSNPMTRGQKIALGVVAGVTALGVGAAIILLPSSAKAAPTPGPIVDGGDGSTRTGKPAGSPPPYGDSCFPPEMGGTQKYDNAYWDAGGVVAARERIFNHFELLGYQTPTDRSTMNDPGPNGVLGGNDDVPNEEVRRFQRSYNAASRRKLFANMGGLWEDGLVGPCTLNGMKYVMDQLSQAGAAPDDWQTLASGEQKLA